MTKDGRSALSPADAAESQDARRYRWLRNHCHSHEIVLRGVPFRTRMLYVNGAELDKLIDAEIILEDGCP